MPQRINLHEAGLRCSPRLIEKAAREKAAHNKAHVTFRKILPRVVTLFTLFSTSADRLPRMPAHQQVHNPSTFDALVTKFHEVNELYDGTMNEVLNYAFSAVDADISSNEVFTYSQAMKQQDADLFSHAMQKEIAEHESRDH